jgi:hypothetical protein
MHGPAGQGGGPKLAEARLAGHAPNKANADANAGNVLPIIREIQKSGAASLRAIADTLNARGMPQFRTPPD